MRFAIHYTVVQLDRQRYRTLRTYLPQPMSLNVGPLSLEDRMFLVVSRMLPAVYVTRQLKLQAFLAHGIGLSHE